MSKITIYNPKGEELKTLLPKGFVKKKLMSDDFVQLEWNSTTYDTLVAGCYIDFEGERYTLLDNHTPTMKDELECRYEPKFERLTWRKYPMLYIEEGIEESEFVIDGKINIALTHIIKSIKKATGEIWQYVTDYNLTDNRFLSFDNFDIISALNHIAEVWECEWWIEGKEIHFGQCKLGDRIDLRVGEHIKVPSHTDFEPYYSKFRVFGSDKNIEQHQSDANVSARARLTLPDTYENSTIVVDEDTDYTTTVVFDEVYPKSFLEISEVKDNNLIKLKDFNLKDEDVIEGKTPEIHFSSGLLEGRDFELERYGEWLVLVEQGDELKFPNDVVKPKVGDSVVLWNIKMPDEYIQEARLELEKEALDYISDLKVDKRQYTARTNRVKFPYLDLIVGQNVKYIKEGHQGLDYELDARVLGFEFDLENRRDGTIIFGNELAKGSIETLKEQVDKIKEQPKAKDGTSVIVKDVLESTDDLPLNPKNGDAYWVGSILYIWNGFTWVTSDLKGDKGEQPYIEEVNGVKYWFIGGVNTWVQAEGEDGDTPYIGQNGNWWIGDEDTGVNPDGKAGPMLVQEGIYSSSVTYVADAVKKPLVFQPDNDLTPRIGKYYYPINVGEYTNISPKDNPSVWAVAEDYQVVLTDTLVALFAKVGGAVFYGDYMISQYGKDNNGMESKDYDKFPDEFTPNLLLDFKSGEIIAHKGTFGGNLKGVSGTFKELYVLDNRGIEAGKIKFGQDGSFSFTGSIFFNDSVRFDDYIYSQGDITQQGKTLVNDLIVRGAFGYGQKAAIVVSAGTARYYYEGYGDNKPYIFRPLKAAGSGGSARYEIPIHTRDDREDNGYVYNLIYFDPVETHYKYEIIRTRISGDPYPLTPNIGYEVTLANVNDSNNNVAVFINGLEKRWNGGAIGKLNFIGKLQQPYTFDRVGGGWLLEYFYDNNW